MEFNNCTLSNEYTFGVDSNNCKTTLLNSYINESLRSGKVCFLCKFCHSISLQSLLAEATNTKHIGCRNFSTYRLHNLEVIL